MEKNTVIKTKSKNSYFCCSFFTSIAWWVRGRVTALVLPLPTSQQAGALQLFCSLVSWVSGPCTMTKSSEVCGHWRVSKANYNSIEQQKERSQQWEWTWKWVAICESQPGVFMSLECGKCVLIGPWVSLEKPPFDWLKSIIYLERTNSERVDKKGIEILTPVYGSYPKVIAWCSGCRLSFAWRSSFTRDPYCLPMDLSVSCLYHFLNIIRYVYLIANTSIIYHIEGPFSV